MPPLKVAEFGQNSNKNGQNLTESGKTVVFPCEAGQNFWQFWQKLYDRSKKAYQSLFRKY